MNDAPLPFIRRLELAWRHGVAYPLLRLLFNNSGLSEPIDVHTIRSLLILRYDRLGDMVVTTPILRALRQASPNLRIGVFASEANAVLLKDNPNVSHVYVLRSNWLGLVRELLRARKARYDVVLNFIFNRTSSAGILANLAAPHGVKVGQGDEKYRFYFNKLMKLDRRQKRMVETLDTIVQDVFGGTVRVNDHQFEVFPGEAHFQAVRAFMGVHGLRRREMDGRGQPFVVFNISATDAVRKLTWDQIEDIIRQGGNWISRRMVVICAPGDLAELRSRTARLGFERQVPVYPDKGGPAPILEIAALIGEAECVVTPDTAIVHFASAMRTPLLAVYTPLQDAHEWYPVGVPFKAIMAAAGEPASRVPAETIIAEMNDFLSTIAGQSKT